MAAVETKQTLEERVATLERQLDALVEGLSEDVIGILTPTVESITWDPDYSWDMPGDELYDDFEPVPRGAWQVKWLDDDEREVERVTHW